MNHKCCCGVIKMRKFFLIAACSIFMAIGGCALPLVSETEVEIDSEKQFEQMRASSIVSNNARARSYVNCIVRAIVEELEEPYRSMDWDVELFEDEGINAFAMPGGKIGVFTGILDVADDQNQLAAVLGHEVAHVTQRHVVERANRAATTQIGVVGAAAVLGAGQGGYQLLSMGAQLGLNLPFGRGQESESDTVGLLYMADAGFDPRASVTLWKNMDKAQDLGPPEFLSTHPSSDTRIEDLIAQLPEALQRYNAARDAGKEPNCR